MFTFESSCPQASELITTGLRKCPFLHNVAQKHGEEYATSLAVKPACPHARAPLLADEAEDFSATLKLFHGPGGVLPLPHLSSAPKVLYPAPAPAGQQPEAKAKCPFHDRPALCTRSAAERPAAPMAAALAAAPLASMSMSWGSNWFNIHHLFKQHMQQHRAHQPRKPQPPQQSQPQHGSRSTPGGGVAGPGLGGASPGAPFAHGGVAPGASPGATGGKCPLRKALGPLAGLVFDKRGNLSCPEPIIRMRSALAATKPVRELRPQALPVKLLAVALTTAALNVPCGMWREHTEKFSTQWFIAVHATIPFIAMLRKAVIMPKYAILFTICSAIAGQALGARLERRRVHQQARQELGSLAAARPVVAAAPPQQLPAASSRQTAMALPVASMLLTAQRLDVGPGAGSSSSSWGVGTAPGNGSGAATAAALEPVAFGAPLGGEWWSEEQQQQQEQRVTFKMRARGGGRKAAAGVVGRCQGGALPVLAVAPAIRG